MMINGYYKDSALKYVTPAPAEEHLEPAPGAILRFVEGDNLPANVAGYRWRVYEVRYPDPFYLRTFRLVRLDDDSKGLQVTQEVMDRCGRLLVSELQRLAKEQGDG